MNISLQISLFSDKDGLTTETCSNSCPVECNMTENEALLSGFSTLTKTNVLSKYEPRLEESYLEAMELHGRIDPEEFHFVISGLDNATDMLKRFIDIGKQHAKQKAEDIQRSMCKIISMTMNDFDLIDRKVVKPILYDYMIEFGTIKDTLDHSIRQCINSFRNLQIGDLPPEHVAFQLEKTRFCVKGLCKIMDKYKNVTAINRKIHAILPNMSSLSECSTFQKSLNICIDLDNILHAYKDAGVIFYADNMTELMTFEMLEMESQEQNVLSCIHRYPNFLESFNAYITTQKEYLQKQTEDCLNSKHDNSLTQNADMLSVEHHHVLMTEHLIEYATFKTNKKSLSDLINTHLSAQIRVRLEKLQTKILLNILAPQREEITNTQGQLDTLYLELLGRTQELSDFFNDKRNVESKARSMNLWRSMSNLFLSLSNIKMG